MDFVDYIYGVYISSGFRYVYIDNPKTGCTSLKSALAELEVHHAAQSGDGREKQPLRWYTTNPVPIDPNPYDPEVIHGKASPLKRSQPLVPEPTLSNLVSRGFRFISFVRNPYTRLVSCYLNKIDPHLKAGSWRIRHAFGVDGFPASFAGFVRSIVLQPNRSMNPHWRPQVANLHYPAIPYTFLGRFEHYARDFGKIFELIGVPGPEVPSARHLNPSTGPFRLRDYYDETTQALVYTRYRADFEAFGYPEALPTEEPGNSSTGEAHR
jgi:hypothetical protein